jgi:hypothetical protein
VAEAEKAAEGKRADRGSMSTTDKVKSATRDVRSKLASLVWLVAVVCALFLAVGALMVALKMNQDNPIVAFVLDGAETLDLGVLKDFSGKNAQVKEALTNWGIAAVVYLVVGRILDRLIRP